MTIHKHTWFKAGLTLSAAGLFLLSPDSEVSASQKWVPRTVLEIENDINKAKETTNYNEEPFKYTVKWGDTLWGVSQATDISVDKLAKVNDIDNPNLIIAGSTVYVTDDLSVVSVQNDEEVVSYDVSSDDVKETETPADVAKAQDNKKAEEEAAAQAAAEQKAEEEAAAQAAAEQKAEEEAAAQAAAEQKAEEEAAAQAAAEQKAEEEAAAQAAAEQKAEEEAASQAAAEQQAEEEAAAQAAAGQKAEEEAAAQAAAEQKAEEEAAAQAAAEQKAEEEAAAQAAAEQKAEEEAATQAAAEQAAEKEDTAQDAAESGTWMSVEATAYSRHEPGLTNFTFTGIDLRENTRVIAVDPDVIPLGTEVFIPGYGEYIAGDTGGAINGEIIDLHMEDLEEMRQFGRRQIDIKILD
ncbi:3D domain-containing protein [Alkalibacterium putridalgicola]|uniref:3D domain-containing protein n=1 Tax=Alkalibacterium putridalgicola TaxID=426703 RepID=UPI0034CF1159